MKVLLIITDKTGLQYHRQIAPHQAIKRQVMATIDFTQDISMISDTDLASYDIVHYIRKIGEHESTKLIYNRCKALGCKLVFDLDDYPHLSQDHPMFKLWAVQNTSRLIKESLINCDIVTTTTERLKEYLITQTDKPIYVLPNAIDKTDQQWNEELIPSPLIRFGWIGGNHHLNDIKIMKDDITKVYKKLKGFQLCQSLSATREGMEIERIFSCDYKYITTNYSDYLKQINFHFNYEMGFHQPYKRILTTEIKDYATLYNHIDIALIPLRYNNFNSFKSELKLVEAGAKGKAAIVSKVPPYDSFPDDCVEFITDNNGGWFKAIRKLLHDPDYRKEKALKLKSYIDKNFNIDEIAKKRIEIYKSLIGNK